MRRHEAKPARAVGAGGGQLQRALAVLCALVDGLDGLKGSSIRTGARLWPCTSYLPSQINSAMPERNWGGTHSTTVHRVLGWRGRLRAFSRAGACPERSRRSARATQPLTLPAANATLPYTSHAWTSSGAETG